MMVLLAVGLAACDWNREPLPCDCPHLEQAVDAINWAPSLELVSQGNARGGGAIETVRLFRGENADSEAFESRVAGAMEIAGYEVSPEPGGAIRGVSGDLIVTVSELVPSASSEFSGIRVAVIYEGRDNPELSELLTPLRDALEET